MDNVNRTVVEDFKDSSIVYLSNGDIRVLDPTDPEKPFNERKELNFPLGVPEPQNPGFNGYCDVEQSLIHQKNVQEKDERDWKDYCTELKASMADKLLTGGPIEVKRPGKESWFVSVLFKQNARGSAARNFFYSRSEWRPDPADLKLVDDAIEDAIWQEINNVGEYRTYVCIR